MDARMHFSSTIDGPKFPYHRSAKESSPFSRFVSISQAGALRIAVHIHHRVRPVFARDKPGPRPPPATYEYTQGQRQERKVREAESRALGGKKVQSADSTRTNLLALALPQQSSAGRVCASRQQNNVHFSLGGRGDRYCVSDALQLRSNTRVSRFRPACLCTRDTIHTQQRSSSCRRPGTSVPFVLSSEPSVW